MAKAAVVDGGGGGGGGCGVCLVLSKFYCLCLPGLNPFSSECLAASASGSFLVLFACISSVFVFSFLARFQPGLSVLQSVVALA